MNHLEAEQEEKELAKLLNTKHPDLIVHIDVFEATDEIVISFFWNRITMERWNDATSFKCQSKDYQKVLKTEIIPHFI